MFDTVSLGAPEDAIGFVAWRITHRFQREVERAIRHLDLTHLQFTVLALVAWMSREEGPVVAADLARLGDIHPMQVSNVIRALEGKRFVRRRARGRALNVMMTDAGLEALRAALPLTKEVQARLFGPEGLPGGALLEKLLRIDREET